MTGRNSRLITLIKKLPSMQVDTLLYSPGKNQPDNGDST
jgi:hypothetical protein